MLEVFAKVLPLAIASAASPVILGVAIALLSKKNFGGAAAFLLGGVLVAIILAAAGATIAAGDDKAAESLGYPPSAFDVAVGALLLLFGINVFFEKPSEKRNMPDGKGGRHMAKWLAIGFIANITNFDAVLLNVTAVREIFNSGIATAPKLELLAFADFFFLLPALLPVAVYVIAPSAAQRMLSPVGDAMNRYGRYVVGVIFIAFGAYMIMNGI